MLIGFNKCSPSKLSLIFYFDMIARIHPLNKFCPYYNILREKSLAIYFEDTQFRRNMTFNFIVSKIYVAKRSRVRCH